MMLRTLATRATRVAGRRAFQSSSRVLAEDAAEGAEATKVTLNFAVPHQAIYESTEGKLFKEKKNPQLPPPTTCLLSSKRLKKRNVYLFVLLPLQFSCFSFFMH